MGQAIRLEQRKYYRLSPNGAEVNAKPVASHGNRHFQIFGKAGTFTHRKQARELCIPHHFVIGIAPQAKDSLRKTWRLKKFLLANLYVKMLVEEF